MNALDSPERSATAPLNEETPLRFQWSVCVWYESVFMFVIGSIPDTHAARPCPLRSRASRGLRADVTWIPYRHRPTGSVTLRYASITETRPGVRSGTVPAYASRVRPCVEKYIHIKDTSVHHACHSRRV